MSASVKDSDSLCSHLFWGKAYCALRIKSAVFVNQSLTCLVMVHVSQFCFWLCCT